MASLTCPSSGPTRWALALLPAGVTAEEGALAYRTAEGKVLSEERDVLRELGRQHPSSGLLGDGAVQRAQVEEAVERVKDVASLELWFVLRTFAAGWSVTLADLVLLGPVESLPEAALGVHSRRWRSLLRQRLNLESQAQLQTGGLINHGSQGSFAKMELTGAIMGQVVVRFPPEPSGYLHIGHAKAVLLNQYYKDTYQGRLLVRFDDTNPVKEKQEYIDAILGDLDSLGIQPDQVSYTSDNFGYILERAKVLIEEGRAYVDAQDRDTIRTQRYNSEQSPHRQDSIAVHLERWAAMLAGSELGQTYVLRALIPLAEQTNSALRDPALARCLGPDTCHPRTGNTYRCYPTYDLAITCCDSLEGVTHAMRDSQYEERVPLYQWMMKALHVAQPPHIRQFSRINFTHTILSKRKLQYFVDQGLVSGWDDPALPTLRGVLRRGLSVQALREFILAQGASLSRTNMSMGKLWAGNKKLLDPVAPRYTAISQDCFTVVLQEGSEGLPPAGEDGEKVDRPLHPKNPSLGLKTVHRGQRFLVEAVDALALADQEEFTLLDWGNAVLLRRDDSSRTLHCRLHLAGNVKKTAKKISWVMAGKECPVVTLVVIGDLITVPTLPQQKDGQPAVDWTSVINPQLKVSTLCLGERAMHSLQVGDCLQIVRRQYYCVLEAAEDGSAFTLVDIPDGKDGGASVLVK